MSAFPARQTTVYSLALCGILCVSSLSLFSFSNLSKNDPVPLFSARYPYDFLTTSWREYQKGNRETLQEDHLSISLSPFRQIANSGKDINKNWCELGDLQGHWFLFGPFCNDINYPDNTVREKVFGDLGIPNPNGNWWEPVFTTTYADQNKEFGFFAVPVKYHKQGLRFEVEMNLLHDFGFKMQTGIVDLRQTASFIDLTCQAQGLQCNCHSSTPDCHQEALGEPSQCDIGNPVITCVQKRELMRIFTGQYEEIAKQLGLNIKNFSKNSIEDLTVSCYWRHVFPVNKNRPERPFFLIMPFLVFEAVLPTSDTTVPTDVFALSAGNNGHTGLGFNAGINLDFAETLEIGFQTSMTKFSKRSYSNVPVPIQNLQTGFLAYKADMDMKPGINWTLSAVINAYHFLERLSCYAQYVFVHHAANSFCNVQVHQFDPIGHPNEIPPAPLLGKMSNESQWYSSFVNVGLTYDISPRITLGFLWQAPVIQHNAYRSSTILGSLIATI